MLATQQGASTHLALRPVCYGIIADHYDRFDRQGFVGLVKHAVQKLADGSLVGVKQFRSAARRANREYE
jgi:hypothetical protein